MYKALFILFFQFALAQNPILSLVITDIKIDNSTKDEVQYIIKYTVTNNSHRNIKCFFNPQDFGLSLSTRKLFNLYENGSRFDGKSFLNPQPKSVHDQYNELSSRPAKDSTEFKKRTALLQSIADFDVETAKRGSPENFLKEKISQRYKVDIMSFAPSETKTFEQQLFWQKNRYYKNDDLEFYLNEKHKYEIMFTVILHKKQLKEQISEKLYAEIMLDKNFIEGVFYSNKMQIEFKD